MIKANELRLGNWLQFNNMIQPSRCIKVNARFFSSLASGRPEQELKNDEPINEYYQPIPITPEILEMCGFKQDGHYNSAQIWRFKNITLIQCNGFYSLMHYPLSEYKSLHEIQNLYFALTGEELPVNFKELTYL